MKELFIPYEEALAMRELGFDEICIAYYDIDKTFCPMGVVFGYNSDGQEVYCFASFKPSIQIKGDSSLTGCPTYSQVFQWFRDVHNMYVIIDIDRTTYPKFVYNLYWYRDSEVTEIPNTNSCQELYRKYEEAELEAIKELIKNCKRWKID